ncbi:HNH endonuclease [Thiocapsa bogorovii]|uniref:HNH endonuclease n=1 Tax=Thiocapsa bogorovii TaxID=521689 RepID=UPI001E38D12A|nr:HNH endonuclease [Thiocapsa bogorovii]UHD15176.1 HNH endonuclease [Thiocapsa bogorovii]
MNMTENGDFTFPRSLFEIWYLESLLLANDHLGTETLTSLNFRTTVIKTGESLIVTLAIRSGLLVHRRSTRVAGLDSGWRWLCDLGIPLSQAMAISEFGRRLTVRKEPEIYLSVPRRSSADSTWSQDSIEPDQFKRLLSLGWLAASGWVVLPPIDGNIIKETARQLDAVVDWSEPARLMVSDGQMTLWARQANENETVAEFELGRSAIPDASFTIPRWLISSFFVEPLEQYQLAFCVERREAALLLPNNSALVFNTEVRGLKKQTSLPSTRHVLRKREEGDLFSFLHLLDGKGSDRSPSWLDNFDDLFLETMRYLSYSPGDPCATFEISEDGGGFFEVARFDSGHGAGKFFSLNFSHHHDHQSFQEMCSEVMKEVELEMFGACGRSLSEVSWACVTFRDCALHKLRGQVRQILSIVWGFVPQSFSRVVWRNLHKRYSRSEQILDCQPKRERIEVVRFDRDREPRDFTKALYDNSCQACGYKIVGPNETGCSEVHHIRPLSESGPDVVGNMLVLCPTHHKEFDLSILAIDPDSFRISSLASSHPLHDQALRIRSEHRLDLHCLKWARERQEALAQQMPKPVER